MSSTPELLLTTAERLFAERGVDAVSLREIGRSAGQRNNSVTQYHYGTKEALLRAILIQRLTPVNDEIIALVGEARGRPSDEQVPAIAHALARPFAQRVDDPRYQSFHPLFAQVLTSPSWSPLVTDDAQLMRGVATVGEALAASSPLPVDVTAPRVALGSLLVATATASRGRFLHHPDDRGDVDGFVRLMTDTVAGIFCAPVGAAVC